MHFSRLKYDLQLYACFYTAKNYFHFFKVTYFNSSQIPILLPTTLGTSGTQSRARLSHYSALIDDITWRFTVVMGSIHELRKTPLLKIFARVEILSLRHLLLGTGSDVNILIYSYKVILSVVLIL